MVDDSSLRWQACADAGDAARRAADLILRAATAAISARGRFRLVLAGGRTPRSVYALLLAAEVDWPHWELYLGDERCLAPEDGARNSMLVAALLTRVPDGAAHPIPAELGPAAAARAYAPVVADAVPFDLVMLGVGEDGHAASLFPGHPLDEAAWTVAVHDAPKPPPGRVSLGLRALRATREVLVLVVGPDKADAVARWRAGEDLPIARITAGLPGHVLLDASAGVDAGNPA